ncbi:Wzz/FepE/Etk N-terminal domain-containing protein [Vibrio parahaemolyticus]|uniref:Wzz/FepE/Etk N-terminal domain-containing protein n=1 Tax=Vibrio parahaemolyticus TaxID=670 RepID=UPI000471B6B8|nr:Wzz/FepE/Etk N-terminal domain-containing protein [Vibrio parahaemolyticus]MCI4893123.1 Wzz/FepE/Etk N-terminal domain-containing protein [Vibrio parahaemolyticus]MDF4959003.1 Wzz/FepE/Etk N-terminal domain-containing protein [Vibrio parahaemolyticus]MDF5175835.1 Wzz/FepE/Etk N-terminal domain-containing protein [Vibrio parahaemolyticus]MDF5297416.1 Wzz/FepE/Etk N-terminal domain-containing protein [Vibrio parahaemolyticus]MDF5433319.1 Wzz/FepE/Etk N-terminal domain-containing protein [Vibr
MEPQKEPNPNYLPYPPQSTDDEIDLRELFKALWKGKWIIIATTLIFAIGSVLYALSLPNIYKADALLAPAESSNGGGLSKMAGQLGGLATLAGVNLGNADSSQADLAVQVMKSRKFIDSFIKTHDLLIPLMAVKSWDLENDKLVIDPEIYNLDLKKWQRKPKGLRGAEPSSQEVFEFFIKEVFSINQDKDSGLYTIAIKHYSPYVAKSWVNWLIEDINKVMRERAISETSQNLFYLNEQLDKTSIADMQNTFYKLIEEQTKSLMLAEAQDEFVFKVIDPAIVPDKKDNPNRLLIIIIGSILGLMLGSGFVFVRFLATKNSKKLSFHEL